MFRILLSANIMGQELDEQLNVGNMSGINDVMVCCYRKIINMQCILIVADYFSNIFFIQVSGSIRASRQGATSLNQSESRIQGKAGDEMMAVITCLINILQH